MKTLKTIGLSVCILCLIIIANVFWNSKHPAYSYSATCLESKPNDSKFLGHSIVANDNYLAVGDPGANKVVIYSHNLDNSWDRLQEIYPPTNTVSKNLGYGFGYELAINNNLLVIKAFALGWDRNDENDGSQDLAEVYAVSLAQKDRDFTPVKIKYPNPDKTSVSAISSFNNNVAFTTRTILNAKQKTNRVYIADPISGEIIKSIESSKIQYTDTDKSNSFITNLDVYKESLILGILRSDWHNNSIFLIRPDSRLEKIVFDLKKVDRESKNSFLSEYSLLTFTTSDELTAIGRNFSFDSNTLVFKGFPEIEQSQTFQSSGVLDTYKSLVLISHRTPPGSMPVYKEGQPDHTLIEANENEIAVKSVITWEREPEFQPPDYKLPFIKVVGSIGNKGLFLSAEGRVIYLPIKNIPERYEIKLSICGE